MVRTLFGIHKDAVHTVYIYGGTHLALVNTFCAVHKELDAELMQLGRSFGGSVRPVTQERWDARLRGEVTDLPKTDGSRHEHARLILSRSRHSLSWKRFG